MQSLRAIAHWIENVNQPLEDQAEAAINNILLTYSKKTQITLVALAHFKLKKMVEWLQIADQCEKRLQDLLNDEDTKWSPEELRKNIELVHKQMEDAMRFLERMADKASTMPKSVQDESQRVLPRGQTGEKLFDTPIKRERLLTIVKHLEAEAGKAVEDFEKQEAIEAEIVGDEGEKLIDAGSLFDKLKG